MQQDMKTRRLAVEALLSLDGNILLWIQEHIRNGALTPFMTGITALGNHGYIWIALVLLLLVWKGARMVGALAAVSMIINFIINNMILKNLVARIRPYEVVQGLQLMIEKQRDLSFPSGHASCAFSVATVMFLVMPRKYGVPAMILAFAISLSRLYVGVHYPTDVLAGGLSGALIGLGVVYGYRMVERKR